MRCGVTSIVVALVTCVKTSTAAFSISSKVALHQQNHIDTDATVKNEQDLCCLPERTTRRAMITSLAISVPTMLSCRTKVNAFDGGVGGLGKTKPETGVVFYDPDASPSDNMNKDIFTNELVTPNGTPVLVSFQAPWPLLKTSTSIESRSISNPDSSFVQVADLSNGKTSLLLNEKGIINKSFFIDTIFGQQGKFGAYGAPTDIKIKALSPSLYSAQFTALTPAMRETERKVIISTSIITDTDANNKENSTVFMLVTGTTLNRFVKMEKTMTDIANSFQAIPAPKSNFRRSS